MLLLSFLFVCVQLYVCVCVCVCVCVWLTVQTLYVCSTWEHWTTTTQPLPTSAGNPSTAPGPWTLPRMKGLSTTARKRKGRWPKWEALLLFKGAPNLKKLEWSGIKKKNYTQQLVTQFLISFVKNSTCESCLLKIYILKLSRHDCERWHSVPKICISDVINKVVMRALLTGVVLKGLTLWEFVFNICVYA